jgi:hypothetical protein
MNRIGSASWKRWCRFAPLRIGQPRVNKPIGRLACAQYEGGLIEVPPGTTEKGKNLGTSAVPDGTNYLPASQPSAEALGYGLPPLTGWRLRKFGPQTTQNDVESQGVPSAGPAIQRVVGVCFLAVSIRWRRERARLACGAWRPAEHFSGSVICLPSSEPDWVSSKSLPRRQRRHAGRARSPNHGIVTAEEPV